MPIYKYQKSHHEKPVKHQGYSKKFMNFQIKIHEFFTLLPLVPKLSISFQLKDFLKDGNHIILYPSVTEV